MSASPTTQPTARDASYEWEENYKRRARTLDYVNPNSTRRRGGRARSADAVRPQYQYRTQHPSSSQEELAQHRAQCLHIFYPTDDESTAKVIYPDDPTDFSQQFPKASSAIYPSRGRSTSPPTRRERGRTRTRPYTESNVSGSTATGSSSNGGSRSYPTPSHQLGYPARGRNVNPILPVGTKTRSRPAYPRGAPQQDAEGDNELTVQNSLLMYGNGGGEESLGTGVSEQELLSRHQKEQTKARWKAKQKQKRRIVQLPSSLLRRQQYYHPNRKTQPDPQEEEFSVDSYEPPPPQNMSSTSTTPVLSGRTEWDMTEDPKRRIRVKSPDPPEISSRSGKTTTTPSRRWRIIPALSRSRSSSPEDRTGAFPSLPKASSTTSSPGRTRMNEIVDEENGSKHFSEPLPPPSLASQSQDDDTHYHNINGDDDDDDGTENYNNLLGLQFQPHPDEEEEQHSPREDPPSWKIAPVADYEYSVDDSAGWDEDFKTQLEHVQQQQYKQNQPRSPQQDSIPEEEEDEADEPLEQQQQEEEEPAEKEWPDPELESPVDDSVDTNQEDQVRATRKSEARNPSYSPAYSRAPLHDHQKERDEYFKTYNRSHATPRTASSTTSYESMEILSDFDPFTSEMIVFDYTADPYRPSIKASKSQEEMPTQRRPPRLEISRSIDELLAATESTQHLKHNQHHAPPSRHYWDHPSSSSISFLNNPPGLNMEDFAPAKPDAPAQETPPSKQGVKEVSPTSVADHPMTSNAVRWSDTLEHSLPTPRRVLMEKPKSILRSSSRTTNTNSRPHVHQHTRKDPRHKQQQPWQQYSTPSHPPTRRTPVQTQRQEEAPRLPASSGSFPSSGQFILDKPSAVGFVGDDGASLSPIQSLDDGGASCDDEDESSVLQGGRAASFERNIPEEYQRAFHGAGNNSIRPGEPLSPAYANFIKAVASVVIQTAVRQFLAKCRVERIRTTRRLYQESKARVRQSREAAEAERNKARAKLTHKPPLTPVPKQVDMFALAAIRIQSVFRGWYARDCITIDNYCATLIQSAFRAHLKRKAAAAIKTAAKSESPTTSNPVDRAPEEPPISMLHLAATMIQAQWRCFQCEMKFLEMYEGILGVQAAARGYLTRQAVLMWLESGNIPTRYIFPSNERNHTTNLNGTYNLPPGYGNHTAFMKQNLSSLLGSATSEAKAEQESLQYEERVELVYESSPHGREEIHAVPERNAPTSEIRIESQEVRDSGHEEQIVPQPRQLESSMHQIGEAKSRNSALAVAYTNSQGKISTQNSLEDFQQPNSPRSIPTNKGSSSDGSIPMQNRQQEPDRLGGAGRKDQAKGNSKVIDLYRKNQESIGTGDSEAQLGNSDASNSNHVPTPKRGRSISNISQRFEQRPFEIPKSMSHDEATFRSGIVVESKSGIPAAAATSSRSIPKAATFDQSHNMFQKQNELEEPSTIDTATTTVARSPRQQFNIDSNHPGSASLVLAGWRARSKEQQEEGDDNDASKGMAKPKPDWMIKLKNKRSQDAAETDSNPGSSNVEPLPAPTPPSTISEPSGSVGGHEPSATPSERKNPSIINGSATAAGQQYFGLKPTAPAPKSNAPKPDWMIKLEKKRQQQNSSEALIQDDKSQGVAPAPSSVVAKWRTDALANSPNNSTVASAASAGTSSPDTPQSQQQQAQQPLSSPVSFEQNSQCNALTPNSAASKWQTKRIAKTSTDLTSVSSSSQNNEQPVSSPVPFEHNSQCNAPMPNSVASKWQTKRIAKSSTKLASASNLSQNDPPKNHRHNEPNTFQDEKKEDATKGSDIRSADSGRLGAVHDTQPSGSSFPSTGHANNENTPIRTSWSPKAHSRTPKAVASIHDAAPADPMLAPSASIHIEMQQKRSPTEQQRLNNMHQVFLRAGIMGRKGKGYQISFAQTTSKEYEQQHLEETNDHHHQASDLIYSWKGKDQTQPSIQGKLF